MFGYLLPDKQELKVKDYALYRAAYCGVCRAIKQGYGELPRFAVSYDAAVLALILIGAEGSGAQSRLRRCAVNPVRPKPVLEGHIALPYVAAVSVLLAWGRLKDAWADERRAAALPAMAGLALAHRRAVKRYPALAGQIQGRLNALTALEQAGCAELDRPADAMGNLLADVMLAGPAQNPSTRVLLRSLGYHMGRWVYLADAIDDVEKDAQTGAYNVLNKMPGDRAAAIALARDACDFAAGQAAAVYDLMGIEWGADILNNLFYSGMPKVLARISAKEKGTDERSVQGAGSETGRHKGRDQEGLPQHGEEVSPGPLPGSGGQGDGQREAQGDQPGL